MMQALRRVVVGALAVGGVGGAAALFVAPAYKEWAAKQAEEKIVQVRVEPVERGRLIRTVSAPGAVEPRTKVQISSRISAQIEALPFREGEAVRKGDVVVRLDDRDLQAALASAEARLRADEARLKGAQASLVNATAEWERISALFESQDVSKQELDNAQTTLDRARSELEAAKHAVEAAKAELDRARENLNFAIIRSPIDGVVTRLNAEVGEVVITGTMNNPGTVIMEIGDLSEMLVKAEVDESDIAPVRVGQKARVYINAYPDEQFEGVVEKIALQHQLAADRSKYFETEILLKLEDGRTLRSGLTANVEIEVEELENVILVPTQAVVDRRVDDLRAELPSLVGVDTTKTFASIVYVLRSDNTIEARPVKTGVSDLTRTAILEGLEEGEPVVVGPWSAIEKLKHGQQVRLLEEAQEPENKAGEIDQSPDSDDDADAATVDKPRRTPAS